MKKTLAHLIFAGLALSTAVSHAVTNQPAEVLSVSKSGPEQTSYNSDTDAPLVPTEWVYTLQVRVGAKVYEVKYETALDYFPTALVTGRSVDARLDHGRMYLETPTGELKASVIGQHPAKPESDSVFKTGSAVVVTHLSFVPSLSPTLLAEQPRSFCAPLLTLCVWASPLALSVWPTALSGPG